MKYIFYKSFIIIKKIKNIILLSCLIIVVSTGCGDTEVSWAIHNAEELCDVKLDSGDLVCYKNTKGGFQGEGDVLCEFEFSEDDFIALKYNLSTKEHWMKLPLDKDLQNALNGLGLKNKKLKRGVYYFYDRHREATDKHDAKEIFKKNSVDFSVAILDEDTKRLLYIERDT